MNNHKPHTLLNRLVKHNFTVTYSAVGLFVPLDQETRVVLKNHPLQMRRSHGNCPT